MTLREDPGGMISPKEESKKGKQDFMPGLILTFISLLGIYMQGFQQ